MRNKLIIEDVTIVDTGDKGIAVGKSDQMVIFTKDVIPGDVVDIDIFKKKKSFAEGRVIQVKTFSDKRVEPVCEHFYECGGCTWQNMNYQSQLFYKEKSVKEALNRIAGINYEEVSPIIPSARTEYYRNRLDFAFSNKRWKTRQELDSSDAPGLESAVGFHVSGKFDKILDVHRCYLQMEPSNRIRLALKRFALDQNFEFYDFRANSGFIRSVIIRSTTLGDLMVLCIFNQYIAEKIESTMEFLSGQFPEITSLYYIINSKVNDTTYDCDHILWKGKADIFEQINHIVYRIGPKSFFQTNPFQTKSLFDVAIELAELKSSDVVYDLYTGVGSIALQAASQVKKVIGIETVEEAIEYAKVNALDNHIANAEFFTGDVRKVLDDAFIAEHGKPDVIITDPPRVGMDKHVVEKIIQLSPERIVYVSCNAASQARDLSLLKEHYDVIKVQPVDMFPHTYHVENIVSLRKKHDQTYS